MTETDLVLPSNRKFGFFFAFVFAVGAAISHYYDAPLLGYGLLGGSVCFLVVTLTAPDILLPLNKLWMRFGLLLSMIVSPIVLGVLYFVLFTGVGVVMRIFGRDELRMKPDQATSFWKTRDNSRDPATSFKNQF